MDTYKRMILYLINEENEDQMRLINLLNRAKEEDELFISIMLLTIRNEHVRPNDFFEYWINHYIEYDFYSLFRMNRATFFLLLGKIQCEELNKKYVGGYEPIPGEKQLMMTLWWLGKGEVLLSISEKFNVAISTVYECTEIVLQKILLLMNIYIVWPDSNEALKIEAAFRRRSRYPGVIGAIDVCNIPFKAPLIRQEDYIDRKMQHSIKLQAICTSKKILTNISVGFPGSVHDARVFRNSSIYSEIEENRNNQYFPDENYHIIGDSAYPLLNWLLTPYRDNGNLPNAHRRHNIAHSTSRIVIEHCFGLLKSRWRILKYINVNCVEKAVRIISACCVLHNFCYINLDTWDNYENINYEENVNIEIQRPQNGQGILKRNNIAQSL